MCRNIKTLFNFDPPVPTEEVCAASEQFVRELSGFTRSSRVNEMAFSTAVEEVTVIAQRLLDSLVTTASPRAGEVEAVKARARPAKRFAQAS